MNRWRDEFMLVRNNKVLAVTFLDAEIFIFALIFKKIWRFVGKEYITTMVRFKYHFFPYMCIALYLSSK